MPEKEQIVSADGARILVVDDEKQIRRMLRVALEGYGYNIGEAASGQEGLSQTSIFHPDVIILDLGLPDLDGIEVIQRLREWTQVPIVVLSVREHEDDKIKALDVGADDYVTKPFSMGELLARLRAALRRTARSEDSPVLTFGELSVDIAHRNVTVREEEVRLTPTEYEVLKYLSQQAGRVVTHRQLLKAVWGSNYQEHSQYLRVYIGQLRRKIEIDPSQPMYIVTEPGVGYRLVTRD
jgi:two-component system, OmpR family, KDP operon response regulator KdpE